MDCVGGSSLASNFSDDRDFSIQFNDQWDVELKKQLDDVHSVQWYDDEMALQTSYWDFQTIYTGSKPIDRGELKMRTYQYLQRFEVDNLLAIELVGNIEKDDVGSGISNCNAELYCYGWSNGKNLVNPLIFKAHELKTWIQENESQYFTKKTFGTSYGYGTYHTLIALVNLEKIKHTLVGSKKQTGLEAFF